MVEGDEQWKLGDILSSRNADGGTSLRADFTAIQTPCVVLNTAFLKQSGDAFRLAFGGLEVSQEFRKARRRVVALEASGTEKFAENNALESHESENIGDNRLLEHQLVAIKVSKERPEPWDVESTKGVPEAKVEIENGEMALLVLQSRVCTCTSAMHRAVNGLDCVQGDLWSF